MSATAIPEPSAIDGPADLSMFLDNLESFAATQGGVGKLRELILDLAVRGKLVEQDEHDEPASELVEKIEANGACSNRRNRKEAVAKPVDPDEPPYQLPLGWKWARFCKIANIASHLVNPLAFQAFPHIAPNNIEKAVGRLLPYQTVAEDKVRSSKHRFFAGQILYSKIRPNLSKAVVVDFDGLCSADIYPIDAFIYAQYLLQYILSPTFLGMAVKKDTRVAMPKINQAELNRLLVAVPPLAEQRRIVAKVDELMSLCDELESRRAEQAKLRERSNRSCLARLASSTSRRKLNDAWKRVNDHFEVLYDTPETLADLRQTILQLAVQGKLVPQDPNDEPASQLLEHIDEQRRSLVEEGSIRTNQPMRDDALPNQLLPVGWLWVKFGRITYNRDGERIPVRKSDREHQEKIYDYYGASGVIDKVANYLFDRPLLLIGEDGANLVNRSTSIAFIAEGKYWVNNHAHVIDAISRDLLEYLRIYINSISLEPFITGMAQPKMNQARMNSIPVPLPPLGEQKRIVARVDALLLQCDELAVRIRHRETAIQQLRTATIHQLLEGLQTAIS